MSFVHESPFAYDAGSVRSVKLTTHLGSASCHVLESRCLSNEHVTYADCVHPPRNSARRAQPVTGDFTARSLAAVFRFLQTARSGGWAWTRSHPSLRRGTSHDHPFWLLQ